MRVDIAVHRIGITSLRARRAPAFVGPRRDAGTHDLQQRYATVNVGATRTKARHFVTQTLSFTAQLRAIAVLTEHIDEDDAEADARQMNAALSEIGASTDSHTGITSPSTRPFDVV